MSLLESQRHLFDVPEDIAYFNCAYNSPQLHASRDRLVEGVVRKSHPWERTAANFFDETEVVRALAAEVFGGDQDGWAVVPAASYGMSTAARALEPTLRPGDRVLVTAEEFPSNVLPWQRAARETGAELVTVDTPRDGKDWTHAILERLGPRVRVVALSHCQWTNGAQVDLAAIATACRTKEIVLAVDATQLLGAVPLPIAEIRPDFVVASGYKWLLGPYGFALFYVGPRYREARPLEESWLARTGAENFSRLVEYSETYRPGARRFDVGETCTPTLLPGAIAALEQLRAWRVDRIAASLACITRTIVDRLEPIGLRFPSPSQRSPHMVGASLRPGVSAPELVGSLRSQGIHISQRGDAVRFAPHLHVNDRDLERLLDAMVAFCR